MDDSLQLMLNTSDENFERILTNPILDIAARFWDNERYLAFKECYRSMRQIDDVIDLRKADGNSISPAEKDFLKKSIREYSANLIGRNDSPELTGLLQTMSKFRIPPWPWQRLGRAMIYDLDHNGFNSFNTFLRYCEGAAIAPASVFVHLCGIKKIKNSYEPPDFDIRKGARALAIFSYLVHIMRDFEKDQLRNLNYFADDILQKCRLEKETLRKLVEKKMFDDRIAMLFAEYKSIAEFYQRLARQTFKTLLPKLAPKYQLSLHIIYALYSHLFEKVEPQNQTFSKTDLNLSPDEVQKRIKLTVSAFRPV